MPGGSGAVSMGREVGELLDAPQTGEAQHSQYSGEERGGGAQGQHQEENPCGEEGNPNFVGKFLLSKDHQGVEQSDDEEGGKAGPQADSNS